MLETSFRSAPEVLRAVDAVFETRELIAAPPGKHDETRHLAAREKDRGCVEVWPLAMRPVAAPAQTTPAVSHVPLCENSPNHCGIAK